MSALMNCMYDARDGVFSVNTVFGPTNFLLVESHYENQLLWSVFKGKLSTPAAKVPPGVRTLTLEA